MSKYILTAIVEASPDSDAPKGSPLTVKMQDGTKVLVSRDLFAKQALKMIPNNDPKYANDNRITKEMVNDFIGNDVEVVKMGEKTTVCNFTLKNGFTIVESSSCVDPENFSMKLGEEICREHLEDKIWNLLGFLLQSASHGYSESYTDKDSE